MLTPPHVSNRVVNAESSLSHVSTIHPEISHCVCPPSFALTPTTTHVISIAATAVRLERRHRNHTSWTRRRYACGAVILHSSAQQAGTLERVQELKRRLKTLTATAALEIADTRRPQPDPSPFARHTRHPPLDTPLSLETPSLRSPPILDELRRRLELAGIRPKRTRHAQPNSCAHVAAS